MQFTAAGHWFPVYVYHISWERAQTGLIWFMLVNLELLVTVLVNYFGRSHGHLICAHSVAFQLSSMFSCMISTTDPEMHCLFKK